MMAYPLREEDHFHFINAVIPGISLLLDLISSIQALIRYHLSRNILCINALRSGM